MINKNKAFKLITLALLIIFSQSIFARNYEVLNTSHNINLINYSKDYQKCSVENIYRLENGQISKVIFEAQYDEIDLISYNVSAKLYDDYYVPISSQSSFLFNGKEIFDFNSSDIILDKGQDSYSTPPFKKWNKNSGNGKNSYAFMTKLFASYFASTLNLSSEIPLREKSPFSISYKDNYNTYLVTHKIETNLNKQLEIMNGCFNPVLNHGLKRVKEKTANIQPNEFGMQPLSYILENSNVDESQLYAVLIRCSAINNLYGQLDSRLQEFTIPNAAAFNYLLFQRYDTTKVLNDIDNLTKSYKDIANKYYQSTGLYFKGIIESDMVVCRELRKEIDF